MKRHFGPLKNHPKRSKKQVRCEGNGIKCPLFLETTELDIYIYIYNIYNIYIYNYIYNYIYIPGTQMTLVLVGKDLLLEAKQWSFGFQVYIHIVFSHKFTRFTSMLWIYTSPIQDA